MAIFHHPTVRTAVAALALAMALPPLARAAGPDDVTPDGDGCAGAVARWREVATRENKGGFMGDTVYGQIQSETDHASALCEAGHDAEARKAVVASMRRHGY